MAAKKSTAPRKRRATAKKEPVTHAQPEDQKQPQETGAAVAAPGGEHADGRQTDNAALGVAGTASEPPASDGNDQGKEVLDPVGVKPVSVKNVLIEHNDPRQFEKKRLVIDAIQSTGTPENNRTIIDWTRGTDTPAFMDDHPERGKCLSINTLEGTHWVDVGDYVIRGIAGEFYPCKPDIFEQSYNAVEGDEDIDLEPDAADPFEQPGDFGQHQLTLDRAVMTAFLAQSAAARAMAEDFHAEHLNFHQCAVIVALVRKTPDVPSAALLKQMELSGVACDLPERCAVFLVSTFRSTLLGADTLIEAQIAAMAEPAKDPGPPKIPEDERSMTLVDEPFALTETANRMQKQG